MTTPKSLERRRSVSYSTALIATTAIVSTLVLLIVSLPALLNSSLNHGVRHDDGRSSAFPPHHYHASSLNQHACHPKRLHLAQRSNVYKKESTRKYMVNMTLSFMLDFAACQQQDVTAVVVYGRGMLTKGSITAVDHRQFNYTSDKSHGLYQSDLIYHVELPNLKAGGAGYWYQILVTQQKRMFHYDDMFRLEQQQQRHLRIAASQIVAKTKWYPFTTPPLPHAPTKLALVGDLGQTNNSTKTMHHIWRGTLGHHDVPISQVLIVGDMAYADSDPERWMSWFDLMEPLFRSTPIHVGVGNHEIECDTTTLRPFVPYENYFYNPNRIRDAHIEPITKEYKETLWRKSCSTPSELLGIYDFGNAFYSYQHGLAHIIVLNSYSNSSKGSAQYEWLEQELRHNIDRSLTPWLVVAFHSPLYTTFMGHVNERQAVNMKEAMESLFCEYGVNMVIAGHDHGYMRTHSLSHDGKVDPLGISPIYLTLGAGGNREQHAPGFRQDAKEDWVAVRSLVDYGYGNLFLRNATHASFTWVLDGVDNGGAHDLVWFENKHYDKASGVISKQ